MKNFFKKTLSTFFLITTIMSTGINAINSEKIVDSLKFLKCNIQMSNSIASLNNNVMQKINLIEKLIINTIIPFDVSSNFSSGFLSALCGKYTPNQIRVCDMELPSEIVLNVNYNQFYDWKYIKDLLVNYVKDSLRNILESFPENQRKEITPLLNSIISALEKE